MRRRLTVTGASQNIDGTAKVGSADSGDNLKKHKKKDKVRYLRSSRVLAANQVDVTKSYCFDDSIKPLLFDVQLQNILVYRRKDMLLTIRGRKTKMPSSWQTILAQIV